MHAHSERRLPKTLTGRPTIRPKHNSLKMPPPCQLQKEDDHRGHRLEHAGARVLPNFQRRS